MNPLETALVVLVVIQIFIFLTLAIGVVVLVVMLKKGLERVNQILGNVENITDDFGTTLKTAVTSLGILAGQIGIESIKRMFTRKSKKSA